MSKFIFITGGVVSSVGKGIAVASIGRILKSCGVSVSVQKLDPYLNVDPGTMSPYQHGEVFVTEDGAETDLDLGHYERFIDINLNSASSVTSGQVYSSVIAKERRGDFLGGTIQVIPHVTNELKNRIHEIASRSLADVVIVEVGGTVGDIEGLPFLEAIRQMRKDVGRENTLYVHVTLLPYLQSTRELKTKPTQHSVNELRRIGIQPDIIVCRSDYPVPNDLKAKISLFCDVETRAVIPLITSDSIYEAPIILEQSGVGQYIIEKLNLPQSVRDLKEWTSMVEKMKELKEPVSIAIVGKYVELRDAYISVKESLGHAALHHGRKLDITWVNSQDMDHMEPDSLLRNVSGIVVPGGFGERGIEGKIKAAKFAREHKIPYLGLCLGMQIMVIEYARHILKSHLPHSTEFAPTTPYPVIDLMPDQRGIASKGGTMRLGLYPCRLIENTLARTAYNQELVQERHRHRFEFNNDYRQILEDAGLKASGVSPDNLLVEIVELKDHPWMIGVQFHPEFTSRPGRPHPLFRDFIGAAMKIIRDGDQLPLSSVEKV